MKNSLLANALVVLIGILMLVAALQLFGWGQGTSMLQPEDFNASELTQLEVMDEDGKRNADEDLIDQIVQAPLFNLDRKPFVPLGDGTDTEGEDDPPEAAEPLKARVTSIIIAGEDKYAMLVDQLTNETVTLKQGMPLPGEQGLWFVERIEPRMVTFASEGEEPVSMELEVYDGALGGRGGNARAAQKKKNNRLAKVAEEKQDNADAQKNSAEEIRRKIAERRAQMRANAAKGKKE